MMHPTHLHYMPVGLPVFWVLAAIVLAIAVLIQLKVLQSAYMSLGVGAGGALLLLAASLVGSLFNVPVAELSEQHAAVAREVVVFGEVYVVPEEVEWPGTVVAVNVGGALIPAAMSLYLLFRYGVWARAAVAVAVVAWLCHLLARPVPGLGIALPAFAPAIAAAVISLLLSRRNAAPIAYVAGTLGVLIGADLTNLDKLQGLGAPIASIGGAGTFDGVFLTGVIAVLIASLSPWARREAQAAERT
jgi:uncharacterized membrane protein